MKFFGPKSVSHFFFYSFGILSIGMGLFAAYVSISFLTGNFELAQGRYSMEIPFFDFEIGGLYGTNIAVTLSLGLFYYVIFFYMVFRIFQTLKAKVLFTKLAIRRLNAFALLNLLVGPILYIVIHFFIMQKTNFRDIHNLILTILIGVFVVFVAAVFKRGVSIQTENDLTI